MLPGTDMRDLEGSTLSLRSVDGEAETVDFVKRGRRFHGYRRKFLAHQLRFQRRYRDSLHRDQKLVSHVAAAAILAPTAVLGPGALLRRPMPRTHVSTSEVRDSVYTPSLPVAAHLRHYFEPTNIVNAAGELNDTIADDLMATRRFSEAQPLEVQ